LNALRSFEAAARHKSFRQAADELCVSHSAISHQVKLLEDYLDTRLFSRKARSVELTKLGEYYYPFLRNAFDQIADATAHITKPNAPNVLTIQLYSTFAIRWLIPRLPHFQQQNPDVQVRLYTAQDDVDFDQTDVDMSVMIGKADKAQLHYDYLFTAELFPVASPTLINGTIPINTPEQLQNHALLQVYPSSRDWHDWLKGNGISGIDPDSGLQFDSYELSITTAAQGLGIAIGMKPYVAADLDSGRLVDLFPDKHIKANGNWWLVCREEKTNLNRVALFREWIIAQVELDPELTSTIETDTVY
jgi:LysR family glycine cleavage system transcriptional activator